MDKWEQSEEVCFVANDKVGNREALVSDPFVPWKVNF
jgi:hypothetical protein